MRGLKVVIDVPSEATYLRKLRKQGWKFQLKWLSKEYGQCIWEEKRIILNPISILANIIVHELIHANAGEDCPEDLILSLDAIRSRQLSQKDEEEILKVFCPQIHELLTRRKRAIPSPLGNSTPSAKKQKCGKKRSALGNRRRSGNTRR